VRAWWLQGGKSLLVPTPRPRTGILSEIQLPEDCDEDTLSKYSTRQVDDPSLSYNLGILASTQANSASCPRWDGK